MGKKWQHVDCFRCNTCAEILDDNVDTLILGDGSLICDQCKDLCNACGTKIKGSNILTRDQAFCAKCFECEICSLRIENSKYYMTSQGTICMDCYYALIEHRSCEESSKKGPQLRYSPKGRSTLLVNEPDTSADKQLKSSDRSAEAHVRWEDTVSQKASTLVNHAVPNHQHQKISEDQEELQFISRSLIRDELRRRTKQYYVMMDEWLELD